MPTNDLSILTTVKATLGLADDYTPFDAELITHINSGLSRLVQLGLGPANGFEIEDKAAKWSDFMQTELKFAEAKSYLFLYVKLLYDPPDIGFVLTAMKEQLDKKEYLLNVIREDRDYPVPTNGGVVIVEEIPV